MVLYVWGTNNNLVILIIFLNKDWCLQLLVKWIVDFSIFVFTHVLTVIDLKNEAFRTIFKTFD
jgi:hypothetical protein